MEPNMRYYQTQRQYATPFRVDRVIADILTVAERRLFQGVRTNYKRAGSKWFILHAWREDIEVTLVSAGYCE